jgi:hypothetical protein
LKEIGSNNTIQTKCGPYIPIHIPILLHNKGRAKNREAKSREAKKQKSKKDPVI